MLVSAAIGGLLFAASCTSNKTTPTKVTAEGDAQVVKGECHNMNACKGQGACGGADSSCAGTNECKGKGWLSLTEAECKDKGGEFKTHESHE